MCYQIWCYIYRKADNWPQKLIMQLMPKQLIGTIGGAYLKNSKSVLFHPQPCDALESLTRVMSSGFVSNSHLIFPIKNTDSLVNHFSVIIEDILLALL